ncbi:MAG: hypothetical protein WBD34_16650 [Burkholderiaceae bacterium]
MRCHHQDIDFGLVTVEPWDKILDSRLLGQKIQGSPTLAVISAGRTQFYKHGLPSSATLKGILEQYDSIVDGSLAEQRIAKVQSGTLKRPDGKAMVKYRGFKFAKAMAIVMPAKRSSLVNVSFMQPMMKWSMVSPMSR